MKTNLKPALDSATNQRPKPALDLVSKPNPKYSTIYRLNGGWMPFGFVFLIYETERLGLGNGVSVANVCEPFTMFVN